ncbi:hypothetical protein TNCT_545831 [Trichonephila clavata]|uniref:Uncharacterized protein n=1 Tax=Trichonephila clavata TaxID=2740835 RepID=A0A8X6GS24_TRICU|nr:hypothetical protein TNCT_545831 [Trichonephila clavata]
MIEISNSKDSQIIKDPINFKRSIYLSINHSHGSNRSEPLIQGTFYFNTRTLVYLSELNFAVVTPHTDNLQCIQLYSSDKLILGFQFGDRLYRP